MLFRSRSIIVKLQYHFKSISVIRNEIIYKQNDESDKVYFVKNGEFEESCKIPLNDSINDEDCRLFVTETEKRLRKFRTNSITKKIKHRSPYLRIVYVFLMNK